MSVQVHKNESRAYESVLDDIRARAEELDDGSFPSRLTEAVTESFDDDEDTSFYLGILELSEHGPTDNPKHTSHYKRLADDANDPDDVLRALAVSAVVSDALIGS